MEQNRLKKLVLNRQTVRKLTTQDLDEIVGGKYGSPVSKGPGATSCFPC